MIVAPGLDEPISLAAAAFCCCSCFFASAAALRSSSRLRFNSAAAARLFSASSLFCSAAALRASAAAAALALVSPALRAASSLRAAAAALRAAAAAVLSAPELDFTEAGADAGALLPPPKKPPPGAFAPSKKYLDPEDVCTTVPPTPSPVMGDVVTASPSPKFGEPKILPEIDPSRFCFHPVMVGTPRGAADAFCTGTGAGAVLAGATLATGLSTDWGCPKPNKERVGRGSDFSAGGFLAWLTFALACFFFASNS
mmetsp:Transcript_13564/g.18960  ORF Transcript_13564/g.18960 Transcript_13564/m.18960 type:complete len:255 (-) Transcript_13564:1644-2408(-)